MKISLTIRLVLMVLSCCPAAHISAEAPPAVTLEQLRALTFARSPVVKSIDAEYATGLGSAVEIAVLKNPSLSAETQFSMHPRVSTGDSQIVASIDQPIRLSDFGSRTRVAELMNQAAAIEQRVALLELTQQIRVLYTRLWVGRELKRLLELAQKKALAKVELARDGQSRGLTTIGEKKMLEGEAARLRAQILGVQSSISLSEVELLTISGCDLSSMSLEKPKNAPLPSLPELLQLSSGAPLSPTSRSDLAYRLAQENTRLAELDRVSALTPRVVYEHTNDGSDFVGAGITIPLSIWDRNQGQRQIAAARTEELRARHEFLTAGGLEKQIDMLQRAADTIDQQLKMYGSEVVPSFVSALNSQEQEFIQGKGSVMQVWQSLRSANEVQEQELALWLKSAEIRSQLSVFVGQEIQ